MRFALYNLFFSTVCIFGVSADSTSTTPQCNDDDNDNDNDNEEEEEQKEEEEEEERRRRQRKVDKILDEEGEKKYIYMGNMGSGDSSVVREPDS